MEKNNFMNNRETSLLNISKGKEESNDIETLDLVKEMAKQNLPEGSDPHGLEHTTMVAYAAKLLAVAENENIFNAELTAWIHDWGRKDEKLFPDKTHAERSGELSKDFFRNLHKQGKLSSQQYGNIQRGIRRHSWNKETDRENIKIIRDADRISRFGSLGLYHIIDCSVDNKLPFYIEGHSIVRPDNAPLMNSTDIKCAIDDVNFCFEWKNMLETESAKKIVDILGKINFSFLKLFDNHKDIIDNEFWLAFLKKPAEKFKEKQDAFANNFQWTKTKEDFEKWIKFYESIENSEIYSEKSFEEFKKEFSK